MRFASPIWLVALVPWAGLVVWLLWGRRKRVDVPFLGLWKGPVPRPKSTRAVQIPPVHILALIVALLLAILAAAGPGVRSPLEGPSITILLDRGITMSAPGRLKQTIDRAAPLLLESFGLGPVQLLTVPAAEPIFTDRSDWTSHARSFPPTGLATRDLLRAAALERLRATGDPVVVLSDQNLSIDDPRLISISPKTSASNVSIAHIAFRQSPVPQLMIRLRNQSPQSRANLRVGVDQQPPVQTTLDLPASGQRDYFVNISAGGELIDVQVLVEDDLPLDNRAFLVRRQSWPIIEPRGSLSAELQRFIQQYGRLRPASEGSKRVAVITNPSALVSNEPAVVLVGATGTAATRPSGPIRQADHPVVSHVSDWSEAIGDAPAADAPADPAWTAVLRWGGQVLVAVREQPARQVWVGFRSDRFATTPQFVIFWTNIFNWLGEGADSWAFDRVGQLDRDWTLLTPSAPAPLDVPAGLWPGLYRHADGALRAVNALDISIPPLPPDTAQSKLAALPATVTSGRSSLGPVLLVCALTALLVCSIAWPRALRSST